jgi:hypothetical protein
MKKQKESNHSAHDDFDSPWKEILEKYFPEFLQFFFPKAYKDIDWNKGYEFLDKELQKITKKAIKGRRYVDKLVKVWLKNGREEWAMIHTDIQDQKENDFAQRMYTYNYRLFDRDNRHAASFAVLGDTNEQWKPESFEQELWGCKVKFDFPVVKIAEKVKNWKALKKSKNPFAIVTMVHWQTIKTSKDKKQRVNEKLTLIKHLYKKGFSKQDIINLLRFIDWVMVIPKEVEPLFDQKLEKFEKEKQMYYITQLQRPSYEAGLKEGREEALKKGHKQVLSRLIAKKFNSQVRRESPRLRHLTSDDLMELADNIFGFNSLDSVHDWIKQRREKRKKNN